MLRSLLVALCVLLPAAALAGPEHTAPAAHLACFGTGPGPVAVEGGYRLLDLHSRRQSNAVAFDRAAEGEHETLTLRCKLRVFSGGDGGAFVFLNTQEYGTHGPAPFVTSWVEPNLRKTFAVGVDVHNPPSKETFTPWGNYQDLPQREISLHWDGREIVKRVAPEEFRDSFADVTITLQHVIGGAEATVKIGDGVVYDRYFLAGVMPYPSRLAMGASTTAEAVGQLDVKDIAFTAKTPASQRRPPLHVDVFNHVLTDNKKTAYTAEVAFPPADWAFGRVILTLDIHDAGKHWDEWDRNGEISLWLDDDTKVGIVPFITSYRTECHWEVDVTHFRPWLAGKRRLEVRAGTNFYKNRGYMMSVSLDFHHGTPTKEPFRVTPLWVGTARYGSAENHFRDFFTPRRVAIDPATTAARVFVTTTGHSQIGEFTASRRALVLVPVQGSGEVEYRVENVLWKKDCYLNPNRPQFGTWQFSRAGWAPGDVVRPWWIDLTEHLEPGTEPELRYEPQPYDFAGAAEPPDPKQVNKASHVVRAYLIEYRKPKALVAAPTLQITSVTKDSSAAKAGIKTGDYLASYAGARLDSVGDLRAAIQGASSKDTVPVVVFRGTERLELEMATGRMGISLANR